MKQVLTAFLFSLVYFCAQAQEVKQLKPIEGLIRIDSSAYHRVTIVRIDKTILIIFENKSDIKDIRVSYQSEVIWKYPNLSSSGVEKTFLVELPEKDELVPITVVRVSLEVESREYETSYIFLR